MAPPQVAVAGQEGRAAEDMAKEEDRVAEALAPGKKLKANLTKK